MAAKRAAKKTAKRAVKKSKVKPAERAVKKASKKVSARSSAKKTKVKAKNRAVKKAAPKKSVKKSAKKSVKKVAKKSAAKRKALSVKVEVPEVPTRGPLTPSSTPVATTRLAQGNSAINATASTGERKNLEKGGSAKKKGSGPFFFILIGIVAIALIVFSQTSDDDTSSNSNSSNGVATASPTPSASPSPSATESEDSASAPASYDPPTGIVAQYTNSEKSGATVFWKAPASTDGISGYAIQIQRNGGAREDLSSTPATQFNLDISKGSSNGWTSFIVQTIYSDGTIVDGKVFGLSGQWS